MFRASHRLDGYRKPKIILKHKITIVNSFEEKKERNCNSIIYKILLNIENISLGRMTVSINAY